MQASLKSERKRKIGRLPEMMSPCSHSCDYFKDSGTDKFKGTYNAFLNSAINLCCRIKGYEK